MQSEGAAGLDLTKVTVSVRDLGISGPEAEHILRHAYKIQCELSDAYNLLFIISYADTARECGKLLQALQGLAKDCRGSRTFCAASRFPAVPPLALPPREAFFAAKETVAFAQAAGRTAAEQVMFYPPGIPILAPGDRVTEESLAYIRTMQELGLKVVGPEDAELHTLKVVKES